MQSSGSHILITGGYGQVGKRITAELAPAYPGRVIVAGRDVRKAEALAAELGNGVRPERLDIQNPAVVEAALEGVNLVVNCIDLCEPHLLRATIGRGLACIDIAVGGTRFENKEQIRDISLKLNALECAMMNNPVRALLQRWIETPALIGPPGSLAGKRVLEVGCGRGAGIEILFTLGAAQVTGFDIDPKMVVLAHKRLEKYDERARVFVGDAEAIKLPGESFDAVVEYGILHHVPGWQKAIEEVARALKPGGTFYFEDILKGFVAAWPIRILFDHPQKTQFNGGEFRAGLEGGRPAGGEVAPVGGVGRYGAS